MKLVEQDVFAEAQCVLENAELVITAQQIDQAISQLALKINAQFVETDLPVIILPVMNGGLILGGHLISRLEFPLIVDYLHATRYRDSTSGKDLQWKVKPQQSLKGRHLLIVDDILDEGYTLEAVLDYCKEQEVASVHTVVLVEKEHPRPKANVKCDFTGLRVADKYVFGFGMDYKGYHRNLSAIYAVNDSEKTDE
jgi:hypoxanthine phosphoribosyltransferase